MIIRNLFFDEFVDESLLRIIKFGKLMSSLGIPEVVVGFSGGKDSAVTLDLVRKSGIPHKAYFNHSFESAETLRFIRDCYPDVQWRRGVKCGFLENVMNHCGMLPTVEAAYCCKDYKHPDSTSDESVILGVRREESRIRSKYAALALKYKRELKKKLNRITEYFEERCISSGGQSRYQLYPILEWTEDMVWEYMEREKLPVNPEYAHSKRVGCMVCCKADLCANAYYLIKYPKLIDTYIKLCDRMSCDYEIHSLGLDLKNNKPLYVLYYFNHSFRPFTKKQKAVADMIMDNYSIFKEEEK